jgi:cytoskeletal protein CcmA (bactofilin family)
VWTWRRVTHQAVTSFIDEGSELEGKYSFPGTLMLNGKLAGDVESTGTLIVGASAVLQATIRARAVIVRGEIVGNIVAAERIELKTGARVYGDVETPVLLVEEGALIEGRTRMTPESRNGGARTA